jgi:hypothetical protein
LQEKEKSLLEKLTILGFKENESKVFLVLLKGGMMSASVIAVKAKVHGNSNVSISVYHLLGREVIKLVNNEFMQAGKYEIEFNGSNYSSGIYFYRINSGDFSQTRKMLLIK